MFKKLIIYFCIFTLSLSFYLIITWFKDKNNIKNMTNIISDNISINNKNSNVLINPPDNLNDSYYLYKGESLMNVNFKELRSINEDVIGYIKVLGTDINYPIVQSSNNDYYLTHSFNNNYSKAGWIYADYRNSSNLLDKNNIIYGHGRLDGTMFGTLKNVLTEDWLNNKSLHLIKLSTINNNSLWQIFSIYTIYKESYYITTKFSDKSFNKFIKTIKDRSIHNFNTSINSNDLIITLSTCLDDLGNRIVVHAKLIKKETKLN